MNKQKHKQKKKKEGGITLIALVITIIIMLILVAVTINIASNGDLFKYAKKAANETNSATARENEYAQGILGGKTINDIVYGETEDDEVPDLLKKYVLGANNEGKEFYEDLYDWETGFLPDTESITDATTSVIYLNELWGDYKYGDTQTRYVYIKYENAAYKIIVDYSYDEDNDVEYYTTSGVQKVYEPTAGSMEGQVVYFSTDGTATATPWLVLYDNGDTIDIMSIATMGSLSLGSEDTEATPASPTTGAEYLQKAINSYNNNVAKRINNYCASLITNSTAIKVRSVGSNPDFSTTDTSATYSSSNLASWHSGAYNNVGKVGDLNSEQDVVRMSYYYPGSTYEIYGYAKTDTWYWLASRYVYENSDYVNFNVRNVSDDGNAHNDNYLWGVDSGDAYGDKYPDGAVRPVVRVLKENVSLTAPSSDIPADSLVM